ncbi:MAG: aminomethyl-transferring glycine dehydrogenase subunit GcvPA [Candidatus Omnitrophota bacterium]
MPYILNTEKDIQEMLAAIGVHSMEDLYAHLPREILISQPLQLGSGLSEQEVDEYTKKLAEKNTPIAGFNSFLGAGCYEHYIPAALNYIISRAEFNTAYTPYQAESSQGILQAIYEYQSYICLLTGMDASNASLFDGASSVAESVLMALRISQRKKVLIASTVHPEYKKTLQTYLSGLDFITTEVGCGEDGFVDMQALCELSSDEVACIVLQSPNFFGLIENNEQLCAAARSKGVLSVLVTNPSGLSILKEPLSQGFDIVCGDGQTLGQEMHLGGPSFGFLATKNSFLRQMPGRIVGKTVDTNGRPAYCLTLQAREQHIRREKATSNICSNQSLNAIAAAVYLSLMGEEGMRQAGLYALNLTHYLYEQMKEIKEIRFPFSSRFYNEFVWQIPNAQKVIDKLYKKNIIAGFYVGNFYPQLKDCVLSCCTEKKTKEDIDSFVAALRETALA